MLKNSCFRITYNYFIVFKIHVKKMFTCLEEMEEILVNITNKLYEGDVSSQVKNIRRTSLKILALLNNLKYSYP